ncbi:MAG: hypothetical protein JXQ72_16890, partial [Anaerolineae bacterium]|nr:hypothetical protein [Anaerolineae bacterium]
DKIVLFGRSEWTTGYTITARIGIVAWSKPRHIAGLLFKWNPHDQGDGTHLPATWSTGLGVYHSDHGLRLQYGVNVTVNEQGQEVGVTTLAERHYSRWRYWAWVAKYNKTWPGASFRRTRIFPHQHPLAQLPAGRQYRWRLVVRPDEHRLTVWPADRPEPRPQLVAPAPPGLLDGGSVGLLSYRAALRLYEFDVTVG